MEFPVTSQVSLVGFAREWNGRNGFIDVQLPIVKVKLKT